MLLVELQDVRGVPALDQLLLSDRETPVDQNKNENTFFGPPRRYYY